jgi:hypothetical protein
MLAGERGGTFRRGGRLRSLLRFRAQVQPRDREAAANPALYRIGVALLLTVGFAGVGIPSAAGSTIRASRPCGDVRFEYSVARAQPGQAMDMDLVVENCSQRHERLRVQARSHGPCPFAHPVDHTYNLPGQSGVGSSAFILAPSCAGRYSVHVKLTLAGQRRPLDVASDGFVIHQH